MLKNLFIILLFSLIGFTSMAQLRVPPLSTSAAFKQTVGLTEFEVQYSRPSARGRKIFGNNNLIPYNEFWRTGANAATKITFGDDVTIEGKQFKKGAYTILTKPSETMWSVYFYSYESTNWTSYVKKEPIAVITVKGIQLQKRKETFTISIDNISIDAADLVLSWEYTDVSISIKVAVKDRVMNTIKKVMAGPGNNEYFQAALFMHETKTDLETALSYIQKVTKNNKARFFEVYREALILNDLGRNKEALTVAQRSLTLSRKAGNNDFVRLNEKLIQSLK